MHRSGGWTLYDGSGAVYYLGGAGVVMGGCEVFAGSEGTAPIADSDPFTQAVRVPR